MFIRWRMGSNEGQGRRSLYAALVRTKRLPGSRSPVQEFLLYLGAIGGDCAPLRGLKILWLQANLKFAKLGLPATEVERLMRCMVDSALDRLREMGDPIDPAEFAVARPGWEIELAKWVGLM